MDLHVVAVCRGAAPGAETPSGLHMFHSRDSGSAVRGAHSHPEIVSLATERTQKHTHSESSLPLCCMMTHIFLVCIPFRVIYFSFLSCGWPFLPLRPHHRHHFLPHNVALTTLHKFVSVYVKTMLYVYPWSCPISHLNSVILLFNSVIKYFGLWIWKTNELNMWYWIFSKRFHFVRLEGNVYLSYVCEDLYLCHWYIFLMILILCWHF